MHILWLGEPLNHRKIYLNDGAGYRGWGLPRMEWTMAQRWAVTQKLAQEYRGSNRTAKGKLLDTLVQLTGCNRCIAAWLLRHSGRKCPFKADGHG
jgi:hypothetical protein